MPLPSPSPATPPNAHPAEPWVRALLAEGKWRQARDELKNLVKTDRPRFLPLLVAANVGLARKMIAGGQTAEARQVLAYLATIAPPAELRALELELAVHSPAPEESFPQFVIALADAPPTAEAERCQLADLIVLAFRPVSAGTPAQVQLAAEVQAVHEALRALSARQWPEVSAALRPVPHRSALSHWVVFVKGVAAFHVDDADRARKCFRALPPRSVPARAAAPYLALLDATAAAGASPPTEATVAGVCRLIGAGGVAGALVRADALWRDDRHTESYRAVRDAVPSFPSAAVDWIGTLADFYFNASQEMSRSARGKYLDMFSGFIVGRCWRNPVETMLVNRLFALTDAAVADAEVLRADWLAFLAERRRLRGPNARLESLAYGWLGEQFAQSASDPGLFRAPPALRAPEAAVELLEKSIALDPANLAAHLQLCAVHTALKRTAERNRLLDEMTARFPDDKTVLVRAAAGCIDRKAFGKGLDYLARARQLDQLDPQIPTLTVAAHLELARQHFHQQRAEKARRAFADAEPWLTEAATDFPRSRWTVAARHGVMERLWGDAALAAAAEARADAAAPSPAARLLFAHFAHRVYMKVPRCESPYLAEFKRALRAGRSVGEIARLLRIVRHWLDESDIPRGREEHALLAAALGASLGRPFTRAEALEVLALTQQEPHFRIAGERLVQTHLREDPADPALRLWLIDGRGPGAGLSDADEAELRSILAEAGRRRDEATTRRVQKILRDLAAPPPPPPRPGPDDPYDPAYDGPGGASDDDDDFGLDEAGNPFPEMPPAVGAEMDETIALLRDAPPEVVRELREKMVPPLPGPVFDALVKLARESGRPPKPGRPKPPTNQMDLF